MISTKKPSGKAGTGHSYLQGAKRTENRIEVLVLDVLGKFVPKLSRHVRAVESLGLINVRFFNHPVPMRF